MAGENGNCDDATFLLPFWLLVLHPRRVLSSRAKLGMAESPECSICLEKFVLPVSTVCGHVFCFECLRQALGNNKMCPLCRGEVTLLVPLFFDNADSGNSSSRDEFVRSFNAANSNHGVREQVFLVRRGFPFWPIFILIPLLYLVWGFDLIPDSIPVFGYFDDIFVIIFAIICFQFAANSFRRRI